MRNEIVNPLFESLVKKAEGYVHPSITEASVDKGLGYVAYARTMIKITQELISNFGYAVSTYPPTKVARDFRRSFKTNLAAIGAKIDTVKNVDIQVNSVVLPGIVAEYDRFKKEIAQEKEYDPKIFEEWLSEFNKMVAEETAAIDDITKKAKEVGDVIGQQTDEVQLALQKYIKAFSDDIKIQESAYQDVSYNSDNVLEHLSNSSICVDFKTYSKIVNEGIFDFVIGSKEDRKTNRDKKDFITNIESLKARLDSVMNTIASARNNPGERNLKALDKEAAFNNIYKRVNSLETKFGEGIDPKGVNWGAERERLNAVVALFNNELEEFNTAYKSEVQASADYSNVLIAVPTLQDHLDRAEGAKKALQIEADTAMNNYKIKLQVDTAKKQAEDAKKKEEEAGKKDGGTTKSDLQIKEPIKRGSKDKDNIKKFQKLTIDKMKGLKGKSEEYDKFAKYGTDGIFGKSTDALIKYLKNGFELKDKSSDITQELIDKISSHDDKLKESFSVSEEFNLKAAEASVGRTSGDGPKPTTKEDVKAAKSTLNKNAKEIMKAAPKISSGSVKKQIDDAVAKAKQEWSKEQAVKELKEIGATENPDYGKNGQMAVATANGIRFYANGTALRLFDKMLGFYSIKNDEFKGNDGSKDRLSILMKSGVPVKYAVAFGKFDSDPGRACKDCINWSSDSISILSKAYKTVYSKSLDKHLASKLSTWYGGVNDDIDAFRKKFVSVLS
jgi:hypothetical protein